jgi:hypothetical protein
VTFVNVPQAAPVHPEPDSVQLTPLFAGSFCTVAVKPVDCDTCTDAAVGFTVTEIGGGSVVIVMVALADFVLSAIDAARSVTVAGLGALAGALYVTDVVVTFVKVPQAAPVHPTPDSVQLTPLFAESFCTVAVKPVDCEVCRLAKVGETETAIGSGAPAPSVAANLKAASCITQGPVAESGAFAE